MRKKQRAFDTVSDSQPDFVTIVFQSPQITLISLYSVAIILESKFLKAVDLV